MDKESRERIDALAGSIVELGTQMSDPRNQIEHYEYISRILDKANKALMVEIEIMNKGESLTSFLFFRTYYTVYNERKDFYVLRPNRVRNIQPSSGGLL
jgi:hypothetical protein